MSHVTKNLNNQSTCVISPNYLEITDWKNIDQDLHQAAKIIGYNILFNDVQRLLLLIILLE